MMWIRLGWSLLILLVMVLPLPGDSTHWFKELDLIVHFALFGILGGLNRDLFTRWDSINYHFLRVLGILSMVCLPELLQSIIPSRSFHEMDLAMNSLGTGWGLALGVYSPLLTYLFVSSSLLGFSFGLNVLKSPLKKVLFQESSFLLTTFCLLIPVLFLIGLQYRWNRMDRSSILILVIFLVTTIMTNPGRGVMVGSLLLVIYFIGFSSKLIPASRSMEIIGLSGLFLFLTGTGFGQVLLLEHGGTLVVGIVVLISLSLELIHNRYRR